jgi:YcxB-like protein
MAMQITYSLTQHDFFDSTIAIRNRKRWAKWVFRASLPVLGLLIVFSLFTSPASKLVSNLAPLLFFILLWAFLLWGSPWWLARTQFLKQPSAQGQRTASCDGNGVNWQWDGGSSAVEWKTFIRWMETKDQILLCSSPVQCAIVPKRFLSSEQLPELRALLTQNIGAGLRV